MIPDGSDLFTRIRWYTHPDLRRLRAEYEAREQLLAVARDMEALAAAWQALADEVREAAKP